MNRITVVAQIQDVLSQIEGNDTVQHEPRQLGQQQQPLQQQQPGQQHQQPLQQQQRPRGQQQQQQQLQEQQQPQEQQQSRQQQPQQQEEQPQKQQQRLQQQEQEDRKRRWHDATSWLEDVSDEEVPEDIKRIAREVSAKGATKCTSWEEDTRWLNSFDSEDMN